MLLPEISIVVITYNRPIEFLALLKNLSQQVDLNRHVLEILLLNNASNSDYTEAENFISAHPELPFNYVVNERNDGVSARNILFNKAKGKYLLLLDDDVEFEKEDAIQLIANLYSQEKYRDVGIITLKIYFYETRKPQITAFPHKKYEKYKDVEWMYTTYFLSGAALVRKEAQQAAGLLPTDFFYSMEEYDFGFRVLDAGFKMAYDGSVKVFHHESPYGRVSNKDRMKMMFVNKCKVAYRYLPRKYFYTTIVLWTWYFFKLSKFDILKWWEAIQEIKQFPKTQHRKVIKQSTLDYLKKFESRLWY